MLAVDRPSVLNAGRFSADASKSYTLPGHVYIDPAVYEAEKSAVFHKSWIFVGAANSLIEPGSYTTVRIAGQNIAVVRGAVQVGVESYSLKQIERLTGFVRTEGISAGAGAVAE